MLKTSHLCCCIDYWDSLKTLQKDLEKTKRCTKRLPAESRVKINSILDDCENKIQRVLDSHFGPSKQTAKE